MDIFSRITAFILLIVLAPLFLIIILLFILSLCITNTIFFIRINSLIDDIQPYINQIKILINLACKDLQC